MMLRSLLLAATLAAGSLLTACTTAPTAPLAAADRLDPATLQNWSAEGKLGLKFKDKGGSLYFTWAETEAGFTLDLSGPLGQGQTRLAGKSGLVTLDNSSTGHVEAETPEAVMQQTMGWQAPVSYLRFWLRGLPATTQAELQRGAGGELTQIREDGWQADIERYSDAGHYHLPSKLVITGPDTRIIVVVSDWQAR